jgi:hypothetical protein
MNQMWKPIPGYEGLYEASNKGLIRSVERDIVRKNGRTFHIQPTVLSPYPQYSTLRGKKYFMGYQVALRKNNKSKSHLVHRLVCLAWYGLPPDSKWQVNHIDGNRENNNKDNLEWTTPSCNVQHGYDNGLFKSKTIEIVLTPTDGFYPYRFPSVASASRKLHVSRNTLMKNKYINIDGRDYKIERRTDHVPRGT